MSELLFSWTERQILDALHKRYSQVVGNGRRYVIAEHVRSQAGFDAKRTADFIALDTWVSKGFEWAGHEIKVSRTDWLRELADPDKAAEFTPYMHRWWVVVPSLDVVRSDELPKEWGLMVVTDHGLRAAKKAPKNEAKPMTDSRLVAFMRAVQRTRAIL